MKISKLLPAACAFVFCVSFASVHAQDNPAQAAARAALMKQMNQQQTPSQQTPPAAPKAPAKPVAPAAIIMQTNAAAAEPATVAKPGPIPIIAPDLPISMTKEQRLQALLALYKADQITPEQYHKQRAAILAEP